MPLAIPWGDRSSIERATDFMRTAVGFVRRSRRPRVYADVTVRNVEEMFTAKNNKKPLDADGAENEESP